MKKDITLIYIIRSSRDSIYRGLNILSKCDDKPKEIIIVQTYFSHTRLRTSQYNLNIKVIEPDRETKEVIGYGKALNIAIQKSTLPFIAILNEFSIPSKNFLNHSLILMEQRPNIYTATPKSLARPLEDYEHISDCERISSNICSINMTEDIEQIENPLSLVQFSLFGPKTIFEYNGKFSEFYNTVVITLSDFIETLKQNYCPVYKTCLPVYVQQHDFYYPPLQIQCELVRDINKFFEIWSKWPISKILEKIVEHKTVVWKEDRDKKITQFIKPTKSRISSTLQRNLNLADHYCV